MDKTIPVLISTEPDFFYKVVGEIRVELEAPTVFHNMPSISEINQCLTQRAKELGVEAVINVRYERGVSLTSWRRLIATGIAVKKAS